MNFSQQIRLFDRRFVCNAMKSYNVCPKCHNEFTHNFTFTTYGENHVKSNRPFLLPCGHNMCENCISQNRQNLTCNVCLRPIEVPLNMSLQQSQFFPRNFFDLNFYLFGKLTYFYHNRRHGSHNNSMQTSVYMGSGGGGGGGGFMAPEVFVQKCSECEEVPAMGYCMFCKVHFCKHCFDIVHKNSKVLKRHKLTIDRQRDLKMPTVKQCRRHYKICDRFCRKCRLVCCVNCIKADHAGHGWCTIFEENNRTKEDVLNLLETIKNSRENLKKAQKDVKSTEMLLEEYATQTLQDISNFFLQIHSFLQLEENRITEEFNEACTIPQQTLREANVKLNESQNSLNTMRSKLEHFQRKPPNDILLQEVIESANAHLEQLPCQVQISKIHKNPFTFTAQKDLCKEFKKFYVQEYDDPQINVRIGPIYGDVDRSFQDTQSSTDENKISYDIASNNNKNNKRNQKKKQSKDNKQSSSMVQQPAHLTGCASDLDTVNPRKNASTLQPNQRANELISAHICYIKSPEHFYIQLDDATKKIKELSHKYLQYGHTETVSKPISTGNYCMAYHVDDKQWYRGLVKDIMAKDLYKVFLIDIGMNLELPTQRVREIDEKSLAIPHAAIRCAIHDIMPPGKGWSEEATQLLMEITQNKPVRISVVSQIENKIWKVDVITTHTANPISVRDSFLYTGLAVERPGVLNFKLQPKKLSPVARINQRLQKHNYQESEMMVQVTHVEDPQEFFVIRLDQIDLRKQMQQELNDFFNNCPHPEVIFLAPLQICCAVKLKQTWHRACVEEIKEGGKIRIRLADIGLQQTVSWNQLFVLPVEFQKCKEFAIKCTLAHIEPLQQNNYTWTDEAIKHFKQICANPVLRLVVYNIKQSEYKVSLLVSKKHCDVNVGAILVKYGHGLSTGEATQLIGVHKTPKKRLCLQNTIYQNADDNEQNVLAAAQLNPLTAAIVKSESKSIKRSAICVRHIESPGEFYVHLKRMESGIKKFHCQIQEECEKFSECSDDQMENERFSVDDHCLVYYNYRKTQGQNPIPEYTEAAAASVIQKSSSLGHYEWHRGTIAAIDSAEPDYPYVVHLRDIGATVHSIRRSQLRPISPQFDMVSNVVIRCHLACVQPTGGMPIWSQTSIDCFKVNIGMFQNLWVSQQDKANSTNNSVPVVFWGMTSETSDPLAPSISKFVNINRILVNAGLAHLVERMDATQQMDYLMQQEADKNEITLDEWFKNFADNNKALEAIEQIPEAELSDSPVYDEMVFEFVDNLDEIDDCILPDTIIRTAPTAWLTPKSINKTIFTAYPTYVDYDCIVYLHDCDDGDLLKRIQAKIDKLYANKIVPTELEGEWTVGQPCIARFHVDKFFYRGIIQRLLPDESSCEVIFIDYGNVEQVPYNDLRPFVPFPKLAAIASKYRIEGICPKSGEDQHPTVVLDIIHKTIVTKVCSVRVAQSELSKEIKDCSIRVGAVDVAHFLISEKIVDPERLPIEPAAAVKGKKQKSDKKLDDALTKDDHDEAFLYPSYKEISLGGEPEQICKLLFRNSRRQQNQDADMDDCDIDHPSKKDILNSDNEDEEDVDQLDERLNEFLCRLDNDDIDFGSDIFSKLKGEESSKALQQTIVPPTKKRMFDLDDYKKMQQQLQNENLYKSLDGSENFDINDFDAIAAGGGLTDRNAVDDDEDVVELEFSFSSNYWHTAGAELAKEDLQENERKSRQRRAKIQKANAEEIESSFDKFEPNETSTVFSHISGIEYFRAPLLPSTCMRHFFCSVVDVTTPTIIHIYPHLAELEQKETEMERSIRALVKVAPALTNFEPKTVCLACYSKDKKWYRAIIRSFNPLAQQADVLYVDYLNTETLATNNLRRYPKELAIYPLRTFRVKLAGIEPNPRMREKDVCQALLTVVHKRTLYVRVKKQPPATAGEGGGGGGAKTTVDENDKSDDKLLQITLYDSKKAEAPIYEELIEQNYYIRT